MSVSTAKSALRQIESEIEREEKKKSEAEIKVANLGKKITDKQTEIGKTTSASLIRSKQTQIKSWTSELNRERDKSVVAGKKLVGLYEKRRKAEQALREQQLKENEAVTRGLQQTISDLTDKLQVHTTVREPNMIMQCVRPLIERYSDALSLFDSAEEHYESGGADRNALDDIRLCFELVLKSIFANDKSLENQIENIGRIMKGANLSSEFRNTFRTLVDYYCKYQDHHVKHDESINPYEVAFIIELTCILMKQMIEQFGQDTDDEEDENIRVNPDQDDIDRLLE